MLIPIPGRRNALAYLFWRTLLKKSGSFCSFLEAYFYGTNRGLNDYNALAARYKKSDVKHDKQYSILPTVLKMVGDCKGKVILDIGCGTGFFTLPLAERGAKKVYGVDNSRVQLDLAAKMAKHPAIQYVESDVFVDAIPPIDIVVAPFVVNYAATVSILKYFFQKLYNSLNDHGKVVFVVDLPSGENLTRFGARKKFVGEEKDEALIQIDLFNHKEKICTLTAIYFSKETITSLLKTLGFKDVTWHTPIVSEEVIKLLGSDFWKDYVSNPELGYIVAKK